LNAVNSAAQLAQVGPGVEADDHAFLLRGFIERLSRRIEFRRVQHGLRRCGDGDERHGDRGGDPDERA
jgi:hypothetical protein